MSKAKHDPAPGAVGCQAHTRGAPCEFDPAIAYRKPRTASHTGQPACPEHGRSWLGVAQSTRVRRPGCSRRQRARGGRGRHGVWGPRLAVAPGWRPREARARATTPLRRGPDWTSFAPGPPPVAGSRDPASGRPEPHQARRLPRSGGARRQHGQARASFERRLDRTASVLILDATPAHQNRTEERATSTGGSVQSRGGAGAPATPAVAGAVAVASIVGRGAGGGGCAADAGCRRDGARPRAPWRQAARCRRSCGRTRCPAGRPRTTPSCPSSATAEPVKAAAPVRAGGAAGATARRRCRRRRGRWRVMRAEGRSLRREPASEPVGP